MAWDAKYYCEWTDILNLDWRVDIEADGSFTASEMKATGDPLTIDFMASSDDLFNGVIKGSRADLTIYSESNFQWVDLCAVDDMEYRMSIYYNDGSDHLYWRGYIITNNYQEPYDKEAYKVTISASDGLGLLKNMLYKYQTTNPDDTYYNGRLLESEIVIDILTKIGYTGFTEYVNIYEESMTATAGYSPFDQLRIDVDVFRDMYCYEVLEEILKKYNAVIRIIAGQPTIYRPVELTGATVYGRIFTADTTKTATTYTPEQWINRTTHTSDVRDFEGGMMMFQTPAKKVTIYQDYGNKDSLIDNWELRGETFDPDTNIFENWTCSNVDSINAIMPEEKDGLWITAVSVRKDANYYCSQSFGDYLVTTTDIFGFSIDYYVYSYDGSALSDVYIDIMIKDDASSQYLEVADEEDLTWSATEAFITIPIASVENGRSGWVNFARSIPDGLLAVGSYTIKIYNPYCATSFAFGAAFKNIRFFSTSDKVISKRKTYKKWVWTWSGLGFNFGPKIQVIPAKYQDNLEVAQYLWEKTNAINGNYLEFEMILGDVTKTGTGGVNIDNILEQFGGALSTVTVNYRIDRVTLIGTSGTANITCNGITKLATFTSTLEDTAEQFVSDWGSSGGDFYLSGVQVSFSGAILSFTALVKMTEFTGDTEITNVLTDLTGTVSMNDTPIITDEAYSTDWNTRSPGSESKELLSIIVDELADQYSRPKQSLSLPVREFDSTGKTPHVNILGNFKDELNTVSATERVFAFNKGLFNVKDREWNIDLIEII